MIADPKLAKGEMCNATDPATLYLCCLVKNHGGPHIATDADETQLRGTVYAQWLSATTETQSGEGA